MNFGPQMGCHNFWKFWKFCCHSGPWLKHFLLTQIIINDVLAHSPVWIPPKCIKYTVLWKLGKFQGALWAPITSSQVLAWVYREKLVEMSVSGWVYRSGAISVLLRPFQGNSGLFQPDLGPFQGYLGLFWADFCLFSAISRLFGPISAWIGPIWTYLF